MLSRVSNEGKLLGPDDYAGVMLGGLVLLAASCLSWPITIPIGIVVGTLCGLRGMVRFKKKVNKTFDTKADKDHEHE